MAQMQWMGILFFVIVLSITGICMGQETEKQVEPETGKTIDNTSSTQLETQAPDSQEEKTVSSGGLFPVASIHEMIKEERVHALLEIDKERKATLAYLTEERKTVVDELKVELSRVLEKVTDERSIVVKKLIKELNRITDLLVTERIVAMAEMEASANRIIDGGILTSKRLIDHFFIRLLEVLAAIVLAIAVIGFIAYQVVYKKK